MAEREDHDESLGRIDRDASGTMSFGGRSAISKNYKFQETKNR